ncbi:hypothetical protein [Streptomyces sp. AN091965]|uniref:hypothetical protein n=1 Tax=Streptomyces sp. AN091965 TaxID=2927803 RepID=UPI002416D62B|nr:hypothetical protein [Streptomyces sp. AN091965]
MALVKVVFSREHLRKALMPFGPVMGAGLTLTPSLFLTGFGSGPVFVPVFDFVLGEATAEEAGAGAGMLNAVQQFAGAVGVAALGTVFFARAARGSLFGAAELVFAVCAGLFVLTFASVGLLPKNARQAHG